MIDPSAPAAILQFANLVRSKLGLPPVLAVVPGRTGSARERLGIVGDFTPEGPRYCPVANTIRNGNAITVDVTRTTTTARARGGATAEFTNPPLVAKFVREFDSGKIPELFA